MENGKLRGNGGYLPATRMGQRMAMENPDEGGEGMVSFPSRKMMSRNNKQVEPENGEQTR